MDIFESLDNLNVSEECLGDIIGLVKAYLNEKWGNNSGRKRPWFSGDSHDKDYAKEYGITYHDRKMTPDQYIQRATRINSKNQGIKCKPGANEKEIRRCDRRGAIENLKNKIQDIEQEVDIPYLDYSSGDQDGFHRAIAAKDASIKQIPVRVFHAIQKGGNKIKK